MTGSNSAQRVVSILRIAISHGNSEGAVWQALSQGMEPGVETLRNLRDFCVLLWNLEQDLERLKGSSKLQPLIKFQNNLISSIHGKWADFKANLQQGDFLELLDSWSELLEQKLPIQTLTQEYVDALLQQLESLTERTTASNLDHHVKLFMIELLEEICRVLRRYPIVGPEGLRDVIDVSLIRLVSFYKSNEKARTQRDKHPVLKYFGRFLTVMAMALNPISSIVGLASDTESYVLPKIEHFQEYFETDAESIDQFFRLETLQKLLPSGRDSKVQDDMPHQQFPRVSETNIRVQTIVVAAQTWKWSVLKIANEYDLTETQVKEALAYYQAHCQMIDEAIAAEQAAESKSEERAYA
jgi:uncharacterized protein (DUF433 family)